MITNCWIMRLCWYTVVIARDNSHYGNSFHDKHDAMIKCCETHIDEYQQTWDYKSKGEMYPGDLYGSIIYVRFRFKNKHELALFQLVWL